MKKTEPKLRLSGNVALVTGAGGRRGLGRAIAVRLAEEGADVAVNDVSEAPYRQRGWQGLSSVVNEIRSLGRRATEVVADVADAEQVEAMIDHVAKELGRIDILVNNAGAPAGPDRVPLLELTEQAWDEVQRVNVRGTFLCSRAAARRMIQQSRGGRIVNVSSVAGKKGFARYAAYCASKYAIVGFTEAVAHDLAPYGITVNAVCPGLVDTERMGQIAAALAPPGKTTPQMRKDLLHLVSEQTPLGRPGEASEVAGVVAFLASADASFLTGLSIPVCGGFVMG